MRAGASLSQSAQRGCLAVLRQNVVGMRLEYTLVLFQSWRKPSHHHQRESAPEADAELGFDWSCDPLSKIRQDDGCVPIRGGVVIEAEVGPGPVHREEQALFWRRIEGQRIRKRLYSAGGGPLGRVGIPLAMQRIDSDGP